ncbi:MAG: chromate transporter [Clostridia bacterium]|nr:chromate transporter [Clostridia bacterium]
MTIILKTILTLCFEFFKTGLLAVGGGLATLPFLSEMANKYPDWFTHAELADMIAVSESTPGPIGVNMATYVGFRVMGDYGFGWSILGSVLATVSLVLPSLIIIVAIAKMMNKYMENKFVQWAFGGLRPAVTGLIAAAGWSVIELTLLDLTNFDITRFWDAINIPAVIIFAVVLFLAMFKKTKKLHPIVFIGACAVLGVILKL